MSDKHYGSNVHTLQVWEACSDAMITFSHDDLVDDIAYIVENDVLLAAVNREVQKLADNLTVIHEAKIKGYELPQHHRKTSDVRVHLECGSSYICSLLVSVIYSITERRNSEFQNHSYEKGMEQILRTQSDINQYSYLLFLFQVLCCMKPSSFRRSS